MGPVGHQWDACVTPSWRGAASNSGLDGREARSQPSALILGCFRRLVLRAASLRLSGQVWSTDPPCALGQTRLSQIWGALRGRGATC